MNNILMLVIVPLGNDDKVIKAAKEAGATEATIMRARGADSSASEGLFSIKIEPEEEIILIAATKEVTDSVCSRIHDEFEKGGLRSGSIYVLPLQQEEDIADKEQQ